MNYLYRFFKYNKNSTIVAFRKAYHHPKIENTKELKKANKIIKTYQYAIYISLFSILFAIVHSYK